jgi:glycerophosphoryl diester phosphodiesterase
VTVVIAHRGASAAHPPGNTIEAFLAAGPLGATWVELDVRRTAEGRLAVHHDPALPDGTSIVSSSFEELPGWVPELPVALDACTGLGVNIEIKNSPGEIDYDQTCRAADEVCAVTADNDPVQPLLVSSFDLATIERVRAADPDLPTAYLVLDPTEDALQATAAGGHAAIHPWYELVTTATVSRAHDLGLTVNVWTVDDPDHIRALAAIGVDGIVTNVPDVACSALSA